MCDLVARTGRLQQRYEDGYRLVAGCIPYRYKDSDETCCSNSEKVVEVLMINSPSGPGLLFPKGGAGRMMKLWKRLQLGKQLKKLVFGGILRGFIGYYEFKSRTHQDEYSPEGLCKASMFALLVKEELESWPEQNTRSRRWLSIPEAAESCRHPWMKDALVEGFSNWHDGKIMTTGEGCAESD